MRLALTPIDTWFFRDGTPFEMGASQQAGVVSAFPPYPPTVAGAIRAALATHNGWGGHGRWGREIEAVLGDGPENLGSLQITGPFVLMEGTPVFPVPRHVIGRLRDDGRWQPAAMLRPGSAVAISDLGQTVQFPGLDLPDGRADTALLVPGTTRWVSLAGLKHILSGQLPSDDQLLSEADIWVTEPRVGIARMPKSRTAAVGALYSTRHVRLLPFAGIGVQVDGVPTSWRSPAGSVFPFGGESRLAACEAWGAEVALDVPALEWRTVALVALTPVLLERDVLAGRADLSIGGMRIVSACVDRPLRIGAWDSLSRAPLTMRNAVAPGSTLFCRVDRKGALGKEISAGLLRIGAMTAAGFGLCAVGVAPQWEETTT